MFSFQPFSSNERRLPSQTGTLLDRERRVFLFLIQSLSPFCY